jgi:hypothetical protein
MFFLIPIKIGALGLNKRVPLFEYEILVIRQPKCVEIKDSSRKRDR